MDFYIGLKNIKKNAVSIINEQSTIKVFIPTFLNKIFVEGWLRKSLGTNVNFTYIGNISKIEEEEIPTYYITTEEENISHYEDSKEEMICYVLPKKNNLIELLYYYYYYFME